VVHARAMQAVVTGHWQGVVRTQAGRLSIVSTCMHDLLVAAGIRTIVHSTPLARPLLPHDCLTSLGRLAKLFTYSGQATCS
jgi:hypothetical protein